MGNVPKRNIIKEWDDLLLHLVNLVILEKGDVLHGIE